MNNKDEPIYEKIPIDSNLVIDYAIITHRFKYL